MAITSLPQEPVAATDSGWRRARTNRSLSEVFGTIAVRPQGSTFK
ncbi:MAG: hypothetical protein QOG83_3149, partial [Alphaproteobacteria bacterium]|nr:hypothetical protein [Alphaproteobacteria bacterium]